MPKSRDIGRGLRWVILMMGLMLIVAGVAWIAVAPFAEVGAGLWGTPWMFFVELPNEEFAYLADAGIYIGMFLLTQWLFLRPRRLWVIHVVKKGRPMRSAVIGAAFVAMLLSIAFVGTFLEIVNLWEKVYDRLILWPTMIGFWILWTLVFWIYWRQGDRFTQMGRMIRGLLAGSILEMLIAVPVQIMTPARDPDCYCAKGSYTGLIFGGTVVLWCFGPGVVLLFMREQYRRERLLTRCEQCGYDLRGTLAAGRSECPECGAVVDG